MVLICVFAIAAVFHTNAKFSCGVRKLGSGLIYGGRDFTRGEYPWIVALMNTENTVPTFFCGGTLISLNFVLSGNKTT